jgi:PAS domain S-box-containing protein
MNESTVHSHAEMVVDPTEKLIRVLHIDDDLGLLKVAKQCLELQGTFQVDTANSADEALSKLKEKEYDAVVSDYAMPGKDGLEFLRQLRKEGNKIPFVIFTGKGREEVAIEALNLGADGYFAKSGHSETVYGELAHGTQQVVEKRRAEQSFLKSEDKYRRLVETLHEGIWVIDRDSRTTFVNPRMAEILGYDMEEMKGRQLFSFMDERGVEIAKRLLERRRQGIKEQHDFEFLRKDGTRVYATLETSPTTDDNGNYNGAVASVMDMTEHKKMEADLRRLATIVTDSNDAITVVDADGRITAWNKGAEDTYGYSKNEALGMDVLEIVPEDKKQEILDVIGNIKMNETVESFETKRLAKNGRVLDVWLTVTKLVDGEGNAVGLATTERDITEEKRLAERLRASEKFTILGQLASSVAHEIRNPLGVIKNSVYFLNDILKEHIDEKVVKHLRIMERNINSADHIINDLLDLARNKVNALEPVDLSGILKKARANLSVPENIKVITKLEKIPKMLLDPERIQRVFVNLMENAVGAMPEGGKLIVGISRFGDSVEITFKDSGVGIPEENMQKLFTPLFTTKAKGLGLGLAICKQIVEGHHGEIVAENNAGKGALFTVRFPIHSRTELVKTGLLYADALNGGMSK